MVSHARMGHVIHSVDRKQEQQTREFYFKLSLVVMLLLTTCLFFYSKVRGYVVVTCHHGNYM